MSLASYYTKELRTGENRKNGATLSTKEKQDRIGALKAYVGHLARAICKCLEQQALRVRNGLGGAPE